MFLNKFLNNINMEIPIIFLLIAIVIFLYHVIKNKNYYKLKYKGYVVIPKAVSAKRCNRLSKIMKHRRRLIKKKIIMNMLRKIYQRYRNFLIRVRPNLIKNRYQANPKIKIFHGHSNKYNPKSITFGLALKDIRHKAPFLINSESMTAEEEYNLLKKSVLKPSTIKSELKQNPKKMFCKKGSVILINSKKINNLPKNRRILYFSAK